MHDRAYNESPSVTVNNKTDKITAGDDEAAAVLPPVPKAKSDKDAVPAVTKSNVEKTPATKKDVHVAEKAEKEKHDHKDSLKKSTDKEHKDSLKEGAAEEVAPASKGEKVKEKSESKKR